MAGLLSDCSTSLKQIIQRSLWDMGVLEAQGGVVSDD